MMCLSLVVLTGYAGHVSLGQFAFVGIGAAAGGRLYQLGIPHLPAAAIVTVLGAVLAVVIGLPALRMRGLFLSVATLGFALATSSWLLYQSWFVHVDAETGTSMQLPRPQFLGVDFNDERPYYWLCLGVALVTGWIVYRIRHTSMGRAMIAVRENELSAASLAQSPRRVKLSAFAMSGAIASLAGFLYGGMLINFSSNPGDRFGPWRVAEPRRDRGVRRDRLRHRRRARLTVDRRHAAAARQGLRVVLVRLRGRGHSADAPRRTRHRCVPAARPCRRLAAARSSDGPRGGASNPLRPAIQRVDATAHRARA